MRSWSICGVLAAVLALGSVAQPALAADQSLLSLDRLSIGAQVRYTWLSETGDEPVPAYGKEFEVGPSLSYSLTKHLALVGSALYGLDNQLIRTSVGVSVILWQGPESVDQ